MLGMRTFKVGVSAVNAEKMWDFAQVNQVHVHFIRSISNACDNPIDTFNSTVYIYEFLMMPETYTAFALSVPLESYEC
jgi:DNA-binding transcriptional regulator PaaX